MTTGLTVNYRSGTFVNSAKTGTVEQERTLRGGRKEYFVRWADDTTGWYLASNLQF